MSANYRPRAALATSFAAVAVTVTMAVTAAAPAAAGDRSGSLQREVDRAHQEAGFVSVSAELRDGRHRTDARAGVADLRTEKPVPKGGYFRAGSVTKPFIATLVLQLEAEGKLSLDDSVEKWLPGLISGNGNDGGAITLRNLLQHTSGLQRYISIKDFDQTKAAFDRYRFRHQEPEDLVGIATEQPPSFPPADEDDPEPDWEYTNTNYVVAGMVIEKVTGRDWRAELRDRILRPLGLRHTHAPGDNPRLARPHARTYKRFPESRDTWTDTTVRNMSAYGASGELITTHRDLDRFVAALLGGDLLPARQLAKMQDTVPISGEMQELIPGGEWGMGTLRQPLSCGGYQWNVAGSTAGSDTLTAHTPDGSKSVVIATTGTGGPDQIGRAQQALQRLAERALCGDDT